MLNNAKMSKSTGNFMTLEQIVEKFGADASRIALADAGDTVEDANFEESSANAAILRLTTLKEWCEDVVKKQDTLRTGDFSYFDEAFENEMNALIEEAFEQYAQTNYKGALKAGLFDFQTARDYYRDSVSSINGMHKALVLKYVEVQALLLAPVAPHFAEYLFREVLGNKGSLQTVKFPRASKPISKSLTDSLQYVRDLARSIREAEANVLKKKKGGKPSDVDVTKPAKLTLFVSNSFPDWQDNYIELVRELFEQQALDNNKIIKERVGKDMKRAMPFISLLKQRLVREDPETVFNRKLTFDEVEVIKQVTSNIEKATYSIEVKEVEIISFDNGAKKGKNILTGEEVEITVTGKIVDSAVPGEPGVMINNI